MNSKNLKVLNYSKCWLCIAIAMIVQIFSAITISGMDIEKEENFFNIMMLLLLSKIVVSFASVIFNNFFRDMNDLIDILPVRKDDLSRMYVYGEESICMLPAVIASGILLYNGSFAWLIIMIDYIAYTFIVLNTHQDGETMYIIGLCSILYTAAIYIPAYIFYDKYGVLYNIAGGVVVCAGIIGIFVSHKKFNLYRKRN